MTLRLFFDGAANNLANPVFMGIGVAAFVDDKEWPDLHHSEMTGIGTSNVAEWMAMLKALEIALAFCEKHPRAEVMIFGDSQLIVYQFKGHWECRKRHLRKYYEQSQNLKEQLGTRLRAVGWIRRTENTVADKLSKKALI